MRIDEFLVLDWTEPGPPLIEPPRFSPVIADPSFLFPEETPSGDWELFAHSAWGLHRYSSPDGLSWRDRGLVVRNAMRPFARRFGNRYLLYYEKYRALALPMTALPVRRRWRSKIAVSESADLERWSAPRALVEPDLEWMRDPILGDSVSNPCAVPSGDAWRLYFSASLSWIGDCGFCEPRCIGAAEGASPLGPFEPGPSPLIAPDGDGATGDDPAGGLGAGSMKALAMDDGWIGLQNRIFRDSGGRSRSAIFALRSTDGLSWAEAAPEPLLAPAPGWTSSHVYACDCRYRESDGTWYLYFNARDGWRIRDGRERVGRMVGKPREA